MATKTPRNLANAAEKAAREAREQAEAYDSLLADGEIELIDGTTLSIPPHPDLGMLDDDRMEAYEELMFEVESYDRFPDIFIPEQRLRDPETGNETGVVLPSDTRQGAVKRPYRKTDPEGNTVLIKPPHSVKVVQACLGELDYKRLVEGGRSAKDVWKVWGRQGLDLKERQADDPKSDGSVVALAPVPEADSE